MNKQNAKAIAERITNEQLLEMFNNAKEKIKDWTTRSDVNKGMTKGSAWNILYKGFDVSQDINSLAKTNMIWEFGDYLPKGIIIQKENKKAELPTPFHQEPEF